MASDSAIFPLAAAHGGFREWFASESAFNLPEDDWVDGWGFHQVSDSNVIFPFNKMMTASYLLTFGVERKYLPCYADGTCEDMWFGANVTSGVASPNGRIFNPAVATSEDGTVHAFAMGLGGIASSELIHYDLSPASGWSFENVTASAPLPLYWSHPTPYVEPGGTLHVFADGAGSLIHYVREPEAAWVVENVTEGLASASVPFDSPPAVVRAPFSESGVAAEMEPMLHVFGLDKSSASASNPPRLVHYRLSADGIWNASKVMAATTPGLRNIVAAAKMPTRDEIYVFAENFQSGLTAFRWRPGGWQAEALGGADPEYPRHFRGYWVNRIVGTGTGRRGIVLWSKSLTADPLVSSTEWTSETFLSDRSFWAVSGFETYDLQTGYPKVHLLATNFDAELIHLWRVLEGPWHEENLTADWGLHMWIPEIARGPGSSFHVYGKWQARLVHYYWSEDQGWAGEQQLAGAQIDSPPVIVPGTGTEQHVLGVNEDFDLVHFSELDLSEVEELAWPWHTRDYYARQAHGADLYKHVPRETVPEGVAAAQLGLFVSEQVEMSCQAFERTSSTVTGAANRGAVMIHESVHMRYGDTVLGTTGMDHPPAGDSWFPHGVYWGNFGVGLHSAIQLQAEYLSDIAEFPAPWVPFSVWGNACTAANNLINLRIDPSQDPGWRCGDLRPFP